MENIKWCLDQLELLCRKMDNDLGREANALAYKYLKRARMEINEPSPNDRTADKEILLDSLLMAQKMIRNNRLSLAEIYIDSAIKRCRADL